MHVWLLQIGETLPLAPNIRKLRTMMLAERLAERDHTVLWWGSAFDHFSKSWLSRQEEQIQCTPRIQLRLLKGTGYRRNVSLGRIVDHRVIAARFRRLAPRLTPPNMIVASTPSYDLAFEAVRYARSRNIPILVDIRDQWPDIFLDTVPKPLRPAARLMLAWDFSLLRRTLSRAVGLTSMMEALLDWGLAYAKRERNWRDRVFYLGHVRSEVSSVDEKMLQEYRDRLQQKFVVLFIGTFGNYHHPMTVVDAAAQLAGKDVVFILAGDGERRPEIEKKAACLQNVIFPGWVNESQMNALLSLSHVGICPASQPALFLPNKAFLYFSAGLPVLSAFEGDMKDIIEKTQSGFYYSPNDASALAGGIMQLKSDRTLHIRMAGNARTTFEKYFDAAIIYKEFVDHIEKVHFDFQPKCPDRGVK